MLTLEKQSFFAGLDNLLRSLHENDTSTRGGDGSAAPGVLNCALQLV